MEWYLGEFWYLFLLLILPVIGVVIIRFLKWRRKRKDQFSERQFWGELFHKNYKFSKVIPALYLLAFFFLIMSIVDVMSGREEVKTRQKINNLMFVLDVSNSMNAEDVTPSRLVQAKNIVINTVQQLKNDKVGIVVFAGDAQSIMPLTTDYTSIENYISAIETATVKTQGTDFLKAMQMAVHKLKSIPKGARQVVLISDGEDNEKVGKDAAKLAKEEGISIITVGIGSEEGAPVPEYYYGQLMGYKMDKDGQVVVSKREPDELMQMAKETNGNYIDGNQNIDPVVSDIISNLGRIKSSSSTIVKSQNAAHYYQYFLAVSLFLFFIIYLFNPKRDLNL